MDVARYLDRIAVGRPPGPDLAALVRLHHAHLLAVPFENLDIIEGRPLSLDPEHLFDKVVQRGRGGFCYELNGLFAELLVVLGFRVDRLSARVYDRDTGLVGPPRDHLCLRVTLDGVPWLCDVGFGRGFREPVRLADVGWQDDPDGRFRIVDAGEGLRLEREASDPAAEPIRLYLLDPGESLELADFEAMCIHHQTSPESHFPTRRTWTRARLAGRDTLPPESEEDPWVLFGEPDRLGDSRDSGETV